MTSIRLPVPHSAGRARLARLAGLAGLALAAAAGPAVAQVSGSIDINRPGVYGRVQIGPQPSLQAAPVAVAPAVIYPQPVIITPAPVAVVQRPIYLYVPPGHAKDWAKHCKHYNACGQPVYFVQDRWVRDRYAERMAWEREHGHHGHGHGHDRDDDEGDHDDRGHGHGHGHDR